MKRKEIIICRDIIYMEHIEIIEWGTIYKIKRNS